MKPGRGGMILTLGILGILICGICSIFAWVMGKGDLNEIRAGRMDPSAQGMTQAGYILGVIGCILMLIGVVVLVAMAAMGGSAASNFDY